MEEIIEQFRRRLAILTDSSFAESQIANELLYKTGIKENKVMAINKYYYYSGEYMAYQDALDTLDKLLYGGKENDLE